MQPGLEGEFKASLDNVVIPYLKTQQQQQQSKTNLCRGGLGKCVLVVEHLSSMYGALISISSTEKKKTKNNQKPKDKQGKQ